MTSFPHKTNEEYVSYQYESTVKLLTTFIMVLSEAHEAGYPSIIGEAVHNYIEELLSPVEPIGRPDAKSMLNGLCFLVQEKFKTHNIPPLVCDLAVKGISERLNVPPF